MFYLSKTGVIILLIFLLVTAVMTFFTIRGIDRKIRLGQAAGLNKAARLSLLMGGLIIIISLVMLVLFQLDTGKSAPLLRPVAEMTMEPIRLLFIFLFIVGLALEAVGLFCRRRGKKINR